MVQYYFEVPDMRCTGCERILETGVKKLDGVYDVDADYSRDKIEVHGDDGLTEALIREIEDLSYQVED